MDSKKLNNKGFTLLEMMICFMLLGLILVAAAQVIASSTEIYYYSKGTSYGIQASQVVATEIRGDLEDAVIKTLMSTAGSNNYNTNLPTGATGKCIYIGSGGKSIYFINEKGEQVSYSFEPEVSGDGQVLVRRAIQAYDEYYEQYTDVISKAAETLSETPYTTQYVGMNYRVKDVNFYMYDKTVPSSSLSPTLLPSGNFPVIVLELTVNSPQYGDYICKEYIALYNYYDVSDIDSLILHQ